MKKSLLMMLVWATLLVNAGLDPAAAQEDLTKSGTTSAKFLGIPIGPRATAMGGAFVAVANDASANYWNPGVLGLLEKNELFLMHSEYFADLGVDYLSAVFPWEGFGTIGLSVTTLNTSEMLVTTVDDPEGLAGSTFDVGSYAVGLSYGRQLTEKFAIGGTAKYVSERIANSKASGIAVDVGTVFTTPFRNIRLGVSISNFGQKMQIRGDDLLVQKDIDPSIGGNNESVNALLSTDRFDLPLSLRIGLAHDLIKNANNRVTLAVDGLHPNDAAESVNAGAEYAGFNERFFVRGGYRNLFLSNNENSYTVGFGVQHRTSSLHFQFDYAYAEQRHLQGIHQFGIALRY